MAETSPIPAAFVQQFEAERARTLRKRVLWYCILVLALLALSFIGTVPDVTGPVEKRPPAAEVWIGVATDAAFVVLHLAMLGYVLTGTRTRRGLVLAMSWLMVGV